MSLTKRDEVETVGSIAGEYSVKAGIGFLRFFLLFGSASAMLGLILVPLLMQRIDRQLSDSLYPNLPDKVITGAINSDQ